MPFHHALHACMLDFGAHHIPCHLILRPHVCACFLASCLPCAAFPGLIHPSPMCPQVRPAYHMWPQIVPQSLLRCPRPFQPRSQVWRPSPVPLTPSPALP